MADLDEERQALRAKVELACRHAEELRALALRQRFHARELRESEQRAVEAAKRRSRFPTELVYCAHCAATWRVDAIIEATRRHPVCLICGGPLAPVP